jgi:hypothetical protein
VTAAALALVLTMMAYFAVVNHVSLRPWNSLSCGRAQLPSTSVGLIPAALVVLGLLYQRGLALAAGWLWVWLLLQLWQWWLPYFLGATPLHRDLRWYAAGGYDRTLCFLRRKVGRPTPDCQHVVLQALTLLAAVAVTLRAAGS